MLARLRLWVKFGDAFACIELNQITTEPPSIPGGFKLGEPLFYCGPSRTDQVLYEIVLN